MRAIADLQRYIAPEVPGCPGAMIDLAVLRVARDLCERTRIWKEDAETAPVIATLPDFDLDLPANTDLVSVDYVAYNSDELAPATEAELLLSIPGWRTETGTPLRYIPDFRTETVRLYPIPTVTDGDAIEYQTRLKPSIDATELADFMFEQCFEALVDGALAELLAKNGKPWSNPDEAQRRRQLYESAIAVARDKESRGIASYQTEIVASTLA